MTILAVLRHDEGIRVDAERLVSLYAGRSKREAEEVLQRGIEDIAARLTEMQRHFDAADWPALIRSARFAARMAEPLGMASFSLVAQDLVRSTVAVDAPARAATMARLRRIADRSVTAIRDLRDMTM